MFQRIELNSEKWDEILTYSLDRLNEGKLLHVPMRGDIFHILKVHKST